MSLELQLRDAKLKPDEILKRIAEKYGFEKGIPQHMFKGKWIETKQEFSRKDWKSTARCILLVSEYEDTPAFRYFYLGPVVEFGAIYFEEYIAKVIPNFQGCRGEQQKLMIIREEGTPDWFPDKIQPR